MFPASNEDVEEDIEQAVERSYGRKIVAPLKQSNPATDEAARAPDIPDLDGER